VLKDDTLVLKLYYIQNTYTVTFQDWDNFVIKVCEDIPHGSSATPPTLPTRVGYNFSAWDTDFSNVTSNLTVTALYEPQYFTVCYDPGTHGTWIAADYTTDSVIYGSPTPLGPDAVSLHAPGYTFMGWSPVVSPTVTGSVTYTAQWTPNTNTAYTIEHYKVDTLGVATLADTDTCSGTTDTTVNASTQRKNYTGYTYQPDYSVGSNIAHTEGVIASDGSLVLKLYYTQNTYTVTFQDWNSAVIKVCTDVPHGTAATPPTFPTRVGYNFSAWDTDFSNVTSNLTVTALYEPQYFTVCYDPGTHGTWIAADYTDSIAYGSPTPLGPDAVSLHHPGWLFLGWSSEPAPFVTQNTTYVAQWIQDSYTVTFTNGQGTTLQTSEYGYGESATPPTVPPRTGYTFAGWDQDSSAWTYITNNVVINATWVSDTQTLYMIEHYKVDALGIATLTDVDTLFGDAGATVHALSHAKVYVGFSQKSGYTKGLDVEIASGVIALDGSLVLKLYYTQNTYTVTFVDHNGSVLDLQKNVPYGGAATAPANPLRSGYSFTGWDKAFNNITSDTTITALYTPVPQPPTPPEPPTPPTPPTPPEPPTPPTPPEPEPPAPPTPPEPPTPVPPTPVPPSPPAPEPPDVISPDEPEPQEPAPTQPQQPQTRQEQPRQDVVPAVVTSADIDEPLAANPQEELNAAAEAQGIPNFIVPLSAPTGFLAWALLNLILMILGLLAVLAFTVSRVTRKKEGKDTDADDSAVRFGAHTQAERDAQRRSRAIGWILAAIILAAVGVALFIITENTALPLVWIDEWTILQLIVLAVTLALGIVALSRKKNAQGNKEAAADSN
jgi:uncharacterized repeat protein (TIGR02543 family)